MAAPTTLPRPSPPDMDDDEPGLFHYYCCDPDRALCGEDLSEVDEHPIMAGEKECPLCVPLITYGCRAFRCPIRPL